MAMNKGAVLRRVVLGLGTTKFSRVIVGMRRFSGRVLTFLRTGRGFKIGVRVSSRASYLLSANNNLRGTCRLLCRPRGVFARGNRAPCRLVFRGLGGVVRGALKIVQGRYCLLRGMSVLSGYSFRDLVCCRRRDPGVGTALLIDRHGASHCLLFGSSGLLYN